MYSLHPYVLKTSAFPIDHSKIYIEEECSELMQLLSAVLDFDFNSIEGLIRCKYSLRMISFTRYSRYRTWQIVVCAMSELLRNVLAS